jgi:hypothetical protein
MYRVRVDPCEGDARGVVDTNMDELPTRVLALAFAVAGDAMANALEAPQFLDVEMDQDRIDNLWKAHTLDHAVG